MNLCIVGTGYVGLVTAACFAEMGNNVVCVDVNQEIVEALNRGSIHIFEPGLEEIVQRNAEQGRLRFTTDLNEGLESSLFVMICVGTPSKPDGSCDLCYVHQVARDVGKNMTDYKVVVNKSTVPVGTADKVRALILEEQEARGVNIEFDVVSNPEFLKEGDAINDFMKPDRVVVGTDNVRVAELLKALYAPFARSRDKMIVMGVRSSEMTKYAANCMLATKISFINEIANICERVGADVNDVRQGIGSDQRIGRHFIYPGLGYGGSCFPKDVRALIDTAVSNGYEPSVLKAVDGLNMRQKRLLVDKITAYFADRGGIEGKTLALWGIAFKPNTDDIREAPALELIAELTAAGMRVQAFDPAAGDKAKEALTENSLVSIHPAQYDVLEGADVLAVATEWNQFRNPDFGRIKKTLKQPVIFDGRNLYGAEFLRRYELEYHCIGRVANASQVG
ncbi:UDPglucose 6-dehydrogenase [Desulfonatronum thiosulfatophilum]|uniref:UDP-glucose 6-dehydrogenase n=1 Tax=Desulfonatronum thiosulfatophilum TaxID=617002 RepID=A0A1G6DRQ7_9BACT|nr:UDP-glucose/GDP-mannose dehydrogenase family protein [Desulfonatronum thiosulfatophilum]SDB47897.1 UDPglucose 6-dehydrogenase [Desulfonatronum thiosulfatophilum]